MSKGKVLAGTEVQYREWLWRNGLNPFDYKRVQDVNDLRGVERKTIIHMVGTCEDHPNYHQLKLVIQDRALQEVYHEA